MSNQASSRKCRFEFEFDVKIKNLNLTSKQVSNFIFKVWLDFFKINSWYFSNFWLDAINLFNILISHIFKHFTTTTTRTLKQTFVFISKIFRSIFEFETEKKNNIDWMFLKRFKKRKKWIIINFLRKSFHHEMKLLKKSTTSLIISRFLQKIYKTRIRNSII